LVDEKILKEAFGSGTAAVISPVGEIYHNKKRIIINKGKLGLSHRDSMMKLQEYNMERRRINMDGVILFKKNGRRLVDMR
jgi:branched-subunit amino acid aminotransferase/4-amino-4-deoxychorismate lyase